MSWRGEKHDTLESPPHRVAGFRASVWHALFALLLAALPLTAEAQNRTPPETATMSHSANSISLQAPNGPPTPHYFLSHKILVLPDPGSTIFEQMQWTIRDPDNPCITSGAVLVAISGMFDNGHLGESISVPMRTCGSHTAGETFRLSWSGDSSKAWRECWDTEHGQVCGLKRTGTGTPARAYFAFGSGSNCTMQSVVTTEMGTVSGATSCWTTVTIQ